MNEEEFGQGFDDGPDRTYMCCKCKRFSCLHDQEYCDECESEQVSPVVPVLADEYRAKRTKSLDDYDVPIVAGD